MKNLITLVFCAVFLSMSSISYAQTAKKTVILVNGVATEVMLNADGTIESQSKEVPDYMAGYIKPPANLTRTVSTSNPIINEVASEKAGTSNIIAFGSDEVALDSKDMESLEALIDQINAADKGFVLLRSTFDKSSTSSDIITQKRVNACKKYLELRGVQPNKILISLEPGNTTSQEVSVFIR